MSAVPVASRARPGNVTPTSQWKDGAGVESTGSSRGLGGGDEKPKKPTYRGMRKADILC